MTEKTFQVVSEKYSKGTLVTGEVTKVLPFGVFVRLDDGVQGVIRRKELSWAREVGDPAQVVSAGDSIEAVVLGIDVSRKRLDLSLRLAQCDPWANIEQKYPIGSEAMGTVVRVMDFGAFIELEPGVDGLVHISEIVPTPLKRVEEMLWVGDTVKAIVYACDPKRRRISLSIKGHLERAEKARQKAWVKEFMARGDRAGPTVGELVEEKLLEVLRHKWHLDDWPSHDEPQGQLPLFAEGTSVQRILAVDDEEGDLALLCGLLQQLGYDRVDTAGAGQEGVMLATTEEYDLVFLDLVLPGMSGKEAVRRIKKAFPDVNIVIITGIAQLEEALDVSELGIIGMLFKPVELIELKQIIAEVSEGKSSQRATRLPQAVESRAAFVKRLSPQVHSSETIEKALARLLKEIKKTTGATACAVFHIDAITYKVSLMAHSGIALTRYDKAKYSLRDSPVKDVIVKREEIFENNVARRRSKYDYLLNLLDFDSCIGLPVPVLNSPDQSPYGLFLFHRRAGHFTSQHFQQALLTARVIGMAIERRELEKSIRHSQRQILLGRLASLPIHEINNKLGTIESQIKLLQIQPGRKADTPFHLGSGDGFKEAVKAMAKASKDIRRFIHLYFSFTRQERRESVNINNLVRRVIRLVEPLAQKDGVAMRTSLAPDIPSISAIGVWLEQVFLNIVLNAIQQVEKKAKDGEEEVESGELVIKTSYEPLIDDLPIKIRFIDNGPGIHGKHLEKLFSFGFTTREDGTGLGLFISKGLMESLRGRISVEESVVLAGTTFLVELPLSPLEESRR